MEVGDFLRKQKEENEMNYKIAVCDDSAADRQYVISLVEKWAKRTASSLSVSAFASAEEFLFHYAENKDYDILLLDIEMGDMDGVALAKELRRDNETIQIVFITGYSDYISEGYEVAALHYLIKPVKEEKLCSVLERAVEKLRTNEKVLHFEVGGELVRVPIFQICYVDVRLNYVTIHAKEEVTVKKTLSEVADMLDERFYRVGRSSIVNLTKVSRVTRAEIHMEDGSIVPLPRGAYDGINRAIIAL